MLRPIIVYVSVVGYFPLYANYILIIIYYNDYTYMIIHNVYTHSMFLFNYIL